jgi:HK97 family phage major capsid protein
MSTIQDLKDQRARVWEQMKGVMDVAERDGRDLSAEERATYDKAEGDLDRIGDQIERQEKFDARSAEFDKVDRSGVVPVRETPTAGERGERYERAFGAYLRNAVGDLSVEDRTVLADGFVDKRALGVGTNTAGGYTVPPGFRDQLIQTMKAYGGMLQVAEIINTDTGANLQWPTNDDTGNVGAILSENTQLTQQDVTLGTNSIDAYMYTSKLVLVSYQLLQDSAFNMEGWLQARLAERVGRILNAHFTTGTGSSQPDGLVTGAPTGKTGATGQTTTVLYDDLIDLIDSLDPAYQGNAQFMLSQASRKAVRKLKDTTNQPLWQPSIQAGVPDRLLGYPYVVNQDMPAPAASAKSILFGDFRQAYLIRLVTDFTIIRFSERYADFLQTGFTGFQRADGTLQNANAVRAYVQSAT